MSSDQNTEESKVPGRTLGFSVMLVATLFVIFFLNQQASQLLESDLDQTFAPAGTVPGFDSAAWFLPEDAILGFVVIPAGPFTMGSNPALDRMAYENERWSDLRRQGEVDLPTHRYRLIRHSCDKEMLGSRSCHLVIVRVSWRI